MLAVMIGLAAGGVYIPNEMMMNISAFLGFIVGILDIVLFIIIMILPGYEMQKHLNGTPITLKWFRYLMRFVYMFIIVGAGHFIFSVLFLVATTVNIISVMYLKGLAES